MSINLVQKLMEVFSNYKIHKIFGWTDSTMALHWLSRNRDYKHFLGNTNTGIKSIEYINLAVEVALQVDFRVVVSRS